MIEPIQKAAFASSQNLYERNRQYSPSLSSRPSAGRFSFMVYQWWSCYVFIVLTRYALDIYPLLTISHFSRISTNVEYDDLVTYVFLPFL